MGQKTLRISSTHSSLTLPSLHQVRSRTFEPQTPDTARLSPRESRVSSFLRLSPSHSRRASVNGIDHALKLNFLSTLGPGIPVTPTASVFGDGLNNFIRRDPSNPGGLFGYTPEEEKRVVHKIDWRIIPILGLFYGASTLNRINLTNARMFAFENSLHATHEQFSWAIAVFYVGYGLAEVPSIIALLYLTPKVWLPASMFIWGCITFLMAWIKIFPLLMVGRFFLGITEAALIPGVLIYIAMFYKRSEQTFRMALLQTFSSAAGVLGGLISGGIGHLDGRLNLHGWQWIFIIESLPTMVLAVAAWFLLTKSPESAPWLDQRETSIAIYRIRNDTKIKMSRQITKESVLAALKDPKVYIFMPISIISSYPGYLQPGVQSLMREPTSEARMLAQLLSSPAYLMSAVSTFAVAILADRTQQRGVIMMGLAVVTIVGYCMVLFTLNVYVNYAGVIIISMGQTPMTPIVTSWLTTNIGGYAKRAIAVAMFLLSSSVAGVIGSQLYKSRHAPHYTKGHLVNIGMMVAVMLFSFLQRFIMKRENSRRKYSVSYGVNPLKILTKAEMRDITDKHPAFRYTL
ncbi:MAG: major facilitator superfamily domain-containing protein [Linnemannia elongata]|nr:MAG: major facilitator superfamily domain-containing protein [Linnemannia elongata]